MENTVRRRDPFGQPPIWLWKYKQFTRAALGVYTAVSYCTFGGNRDAYPSRATIMEMTGLDESSVKRGTRELRRGGVLRTEKRLDAMGRQTSNEWYLLESEADFLAGGFLADPQGPTDDDDEAGGSEADSPEGSAVGPQREWTNEESQQLTSFAVSEVEPETMMGEVVAFPTPVVVAASHAELFGALDECFGGGLPATASTRKFLGKIARELREVGASVEDVRQRYAEGCRRFDGFSPAALAKWWPSLASPQVQLRDRRGNPTAAAWMGRAMQGAQDDSERMAAVFRSLGGDVPQRQLAGGH